MNQRIAKKIEAAYATDGQILPDGRYWSSYTSEQRLRAQVLVERRVARLNRLALRRARAAYAAGRLTGKGIKRGGLLPFPKSLGR